MKHLGLGILVSSAATEVQDPDVPALPHAADAGPFASKLDVLHVKLDIVGAVELGPAL